MMERSVSGSVLCLWLTDPDPEGPKTYRSGSECGSGTLLWTYYISLETAVFPIRIHFQTSGSATVFMLRLLSGSMLIPPFYEKEEKWIATELLFKVKNTCLKSARKKVHMSGIKTYPRSGYVKISQSYRNLVQDSWASSYCTLYSQCMYIV
jgi:hypothetical protein